MKLQQSLNFSNLYDKVDRLEELEQILDKKEEEKLNLKNYLNKNKRELRRLKYQVEKIIDGDDLNIIQNPFESDCSSKFEKQKEETYDQYIKHKLI